MTADFLLGAALCWIVLSAGLAVGMCRLFDLGARNDAPDDLADALCADRPERPVSAPFLNNLPSGGTGNLLHQDCR